MTVHNKFFCCFQLLCQMSLLLRIRTAHLRGEASPCVVNQLSLTTAEKCLFLILNTTSSISVHIRSQERTSNKRSRSRVLDDDEDDGISQMKVLMYQFNDNELGTQITCKTKGQQYVVTPYFNLTSVLQQSRTSYEPPTLVVFNQS